MFEALKGVLVCLRTFTMECGSCEEVRDMLAVSTPLRLLLLCPSASQEPEAPSRAATATAQTPRLPMSVYLGREENTNKVIRVINNLSCAFFSS